MADQNLVYYALVFAAVLALPVLRLVAKQLSQFSGTPNQGKLAGEYGGTSGVFSMAEVAKHNKQDDLWNAGGDATEGFFGPQHPSRVHDMVEEYKIGALEESDKDK